MNRQSPAPTPDPDIASQAIACQTAENGRYADHVKIHRTPDLPEGATGSAVTAFHFTLKFRHIGAATIPLTWLLAATEADCAPVEGIQFAYAPEGEVLATCFFGWGWALPDGFTDFVGLLATAPRVPAFEWDLTVLPHYSHVAARAVEDPERYESIGAQVRAAMLAGETWLIPDVRCPCSYRHGHSVDDTDEERARTAAVLQQLRDGTLRWRRGVEL